MDISSNIGSQKAPELPLDLTLKITIANTTTIYTVGLNVLEGSVAKVLAPMIDAGQEQCPKTMSL